MNRLISTYVSHEMYRCYVMNRRPCTCDIGRMQHLQLLLHSVLHQWINRDYWRIHEEDRKIKQTWMSKSIPNARTSPVFVSSSFHLFVKSNQWTKSKTLFLWSDRNTYHHGNTKNNLISWCARAEDEAWSCREVISAVRFEGQGRHGG